MAKQIGLVVVLAMFGILGLPTQTYATVSDIAPGDTVTGDLSRRDDQLDDGCYYDVYVIDAEIGTMVTITQTSSEIDSYLIVFTPDGLQLENDDYSSESFDSSLTVLISQRGDYEIYCTTFSEETGNYQLSLDVVERPDYYGIFMGIDNYGEELYDAPLCDDDANNIYDAFVNSGLMAPDHGIVLTNRRAEMDNVVEAFDQMQNMVGPNDVFVFFFSGHGVQVVDESRNSTEIDSLNEALALRDADLIDDDFSMLLRRINSALSVVVIDACHSGGVAKDIVDRPGIVCFASSDEDVLSDFAPELDAGGYLAVFFREAIEGRADLDGDGMILMGELTHYLLKRYYQEISEPDTALYGYQELVHERGLVSQNTPFCWEFSGEGRRTKP